LLLQTKAQLSSLHSQSPCPPDIPSTGQLSDRLQQLKSTMQCGWLVEGALDLRVDALDDALRNQLRANVAAIEVTGSEALGSASSLGTRTIALELGQFHAWKVGKRLWRRVLYLKRQVDDEPESDPDPNFTPTCIEDSSLAGRATCLDEWNARAWNKGDRTIEKIDVLEAHFGISLLQNKANRSSVHSHQTEGCMVVPSQGTMEERLDSLVSTLQCAWSVEEALEARVDALEGRLRVREQERVAAIEDAGSEVQTLGERTTALEAANAQAWKVGKRLWRRVKHLKRQVDNEPEQDPDPEFDPGCSVGATLSERLDCVDAWNGRAMTKGDNLVALVLELEDQL